MEYRTILYAMLSILAWVLHLGTLAASTEATGPDTFVDHSLFLASSLFGVVMAVSLLAVFFSVNRIANLMAGKKIKHSSILFFLINIATGTIIAYIDIVCFSHS